MRENDSDSSALKLLSNTLKADKEELFGKWKKWLLSSSIHPFTEEQFSLTLEKQLFILLDRVITILSSSQIDELADTDLQFFQEYGKELSSHNLDLTQAIGLLVDLEYIIKEIIPSLEPDKEAASILNDKLSILFQHISHVCIEPTGQRVVSEMKAFQDALEKNYRQSSNPAISFVQQQVLGDCAFAETGLPLGIYWSPDRSLIVVSSSFALYNSAGRRIDTMSYIHDRICVYNASDLSLRAYLDRIGSPINSVSIHPNNRLIAIGTGCYDGGWMYQGDLWLFDIENGERASLLEGFSVSITSCSFEEDGERLDFIFRYETHPEGEDGYPQDGEHCSEAASIRASVWPMENGAFSLREISSSIVKDPIYDEEMGSETAAKGYLNDIATLKEIAESVGKHYEPRWHIHDLAWSEKNGLLVCRNDTAVEQWNQDWQRTLLLSDKADSTQIVELESDDIYVNFENNFSSKKQVERINLASGERSVIIESEVVLPAAKSGYVLMRSTEHDHEKSLESWIISPTGALSEPVYLGNYDIFNHYLRINDAEELYFLQGTPANSARAKWLCKIDPFTHEIERFFPLTPAEWKMAHLYEGGCGFFVEESQGRALVLAFQIYTGSPDEETSVIYKRRLPKGEVIWMTKLTGQVAAMIRSTNSDIAIAALSNGTLSAIDINTGEVFLLDKVFINIVPTVIISLTNCNNGFAAGTLDGRIIIYSLIKH
ncbi:MAG: hypothetical protein AB1489_31145 [Acidobacteriota bacterium]